MTNTGDLVFNQLRRPIGGPDAIRSLLWCVAIFAVVMPWLASCDKSENGRESGEPGGQNAKSASPDSGGAEELVVTKIEVAEASRPGTVYRTPGFDFRVHVQNRTDQPVPLSLAWCSDTSDDFKRRLDNRKQRQQVYLEAKKRGDQAVIAQEEKLWKRSVTGGQSPFPWALVVEVKGKEADAQWRSSMHEIGSPRPEMAQSESDKLKADYEDCKAMMIPAKGTVSFLVWCRSELAIGGSPVSHVRTCLVDRQGQRRSEQVLAR